MLIACDSNNNRIFGIHADRRCEYHCPICGENVILKKGNIKIHHFAHKNKHSCHLWEPESELHISLKFNIYNLLKSSKYFKNVDIEHKIGTLISDVYFETPDGMKIAIEIQISNKTVMEMVQKMRHYWINGNVLTWWIFISEDEPQSWECHGNCVTLGNVKRNFLEMFHMIGNITLFIKDRGFYICYYFYQIGRNGKYIIEPNTQIMGLLRNIDIIKYAKSATAIEHLTSKSIKILSFRGIEKHRINHRKYCLERIWGIETNPKNYFGRVRTFYRSDISKRINKYENSEYDAFLDLFDEKVFFA